MSEITFPSQTMENGSSSFIGIPNISDFKEPENDFRKRIAFRLKELFEKDIERTKHVSPLSPLSLSQTLPKDDTFFLNLERTVYNYAVQEATYKNIIKKWENRYFCKIYIDRLRSIYTNLSNHSEFRLKVLQGEISFEQLSNISHQEMLPRMWNDLIKRKIQRDESKYKNRIEANTDVYVCKKCRSRKCVYCAVQTRSADEQMSIFVSCLDCGANWKN